MDKELNKTLETLTNAINKLTEMKKHSVTETIFSGETNIIPMADVQHIEKYWYSSDENRTRDNYRGINVITKHTTWSTEMDSWMNAIYLDRKEAALFIKAWCMYRYEFDECNL